jgi:hypothetical protein
MIRKFPTRKQERSVCLDKEKSYQVCCVKCGLARLKDSHFQCFMQIFRELKSRDNNKTIVPLALPSAD